jgi:oxygen-independent coproporphyrinogen-3 oxidase
MFETKDNEFVAWYPNRLDAEGAERLRQPRPAGYYVHIPFCTAVCDYCGFAIQRLKEGGVREYLAALRTEIDRYADSGRLGRLRFECGHFGGGTPSAIDGDDLMAIKRLIDARFDVVAGAEVTVEVNPISFTREKAQAYVEAGVNRISFGVQSFDDETLKVIGRPHRSRDVHATLSILRELAVQNISLDLMYGCPGQTLAQLGADLDRACDTGAVHISAFRLEIIPFTELKLREGAGLLPPRLPRPFLDDMDDMVSERLRAAGYREYGAFNYAKPGFESVHNRIAFMAPQGEYVGFGNGAYSYFDGAVYCNQADVPAYTELVANGKDPVVFAKTATALELMSRYFVLGLKFLSVPRQPFVERFGLEPERIFPDVLARLIGAGYLSDGDDAYSLTALGRKYVNNVVKEFFVGENRGERQHLQFVPTLTAETVLRYARLRDARRTATA